MSELTGQLDLPQPTISRHLKILRERSLVTTTGFMLLGLALVLVSVVSLISVQPASAQCGSQASSCKNCHEVQGQMLVNADGTSRHKSHAFGDFCYICHTGNQQATDKAAAHEGMVDPLSDVKASCQQCHVAELDARESVRGRAGGGGRLRVWRAGRGGE